MSLRERLEKDADRIAAARVIAKAIIDGRESMSLIDKLGLVVTRREDLNKSLDEGADNLLARYRELDTKAADAFHKHHARLDAEETAIKHTDAAIERLGNSAGSEKSSEPQKATNGTASDHQNGSRAEIVP